MEYFQRNTQQSEVLQRQNSGIVLCDTVQSISNVMIDVKPINAGQPPRQIMYDSSFNHFSPNREGMAEEIIVEQISDFKSPENRLKR